MTYENDRMLPQGRIIWVLFACISMSFLVRVPVENLHLNLTEAKRGSDNMIRGNSEAGAITTLLSNECNLGQGLDSRLNLTWSRCAVHNSSKSVTKFGTRVLSYKWYELFEPCVLSVFLQVTGTKYLNGSQAPIKSVLFHRSTPIRLHLLIDEIDYSAWESWFDRASAPYLQVFFHTVADVARGIEDDLELSPGKGIDRLRLWCGAHYACPGIGTYAVPHTIIDRKGSYESQHANAGVTVMLANDVVYNTDPLDLVKQFVEKDVTKEGLFMGARSALYGFEHGDFSKNWPTPDYGGVSTPAVYLTGRMNEVNYTGMMDSAILRAYQDFPEAPKHIIADMDMVTAVSYYFPNVLIKGSCSSMYDTFMFWNHDEVSLLADPDSHEQWCDDRPLGVLHMSHSLRGEEKSVSGGITEWVSTVFKSYDRLPLPLIARCPTYMDSFDKSSIRPLHIGE